MLLTVKDIATLLVAVVGATFAYFSLQVDGSASTTANVTTGKVATLTYEQASESVTLTATAADMAQPETDTKYFATTDSSATDSQNEGIWIAETTTHNDEKVIDLGGVSLVGAGEETYSCTYTVTLSKESDDGIIDAIATGHEGELVLNLSGGLTDATYDLSQLNNDTQKKFTASFELNKTTTEKSFDATLYLLNSKEKDQSTLAGKTLKLKFEGSAECKLKTTPAE